MTKGEASAKTKRDELILYRLTAVEDAVKEVGSKVDRQDNIKKADLLELRDMIVSRIGEKTTELQKQIDEKADKTTVDDLRTLIKAVGATFSTIIAGLILYYLTNAR